MSLVRRPYVLASFVLLGALGLVAYPRIPSRTTAKPFDPRPTAGESSPTAAFGAVPIAFEKNVGQVDAEVSFLARAPGASFFLTRDEAVFVLSDRGETGDARASQASEEVSPSTVRMKLVGANHERTAVGESELPGKTSYLRGKDPARFHTNAPRYERVRVPEAYEGVDVVYHAGEGSSRDRSSLEYDFEVRAGASAERIALGFDGADALLRQDDGDLLVRTGERSLTMKAPVAYQTIDGRRREVAADYRVEGSTARIVVGEYDHTAPLVVDPLVRFSSFLGGAAAERVTCLTRDGAGNLYVSGSTTSLDFPKKGALSGQSTLRGGRDVFVAKLDPTGSQLLYSTYLGGTGDEYMTDSFAGFETGAMRTCAVDGTGRLYVSATTTSADFPTTAGAFDQVLGGGQDVTVSRLNAAGNALEYSTFLGGSSSEYWASLALDSTGHVWITGETASADFPTKSPTQAARGNLVDANDIDTFVTRITPDGSNTTFSTFLGGTAPDYPFDIALDSANNAYIVGATSSLLFPTTAGSLQPTYGGGNPGPGPQGDGYLTKFTLAANGTATVGFSTYFGGSREDFGQAIAIGNDGAIYLAGVTNSLNFPGQVGRPGDATDEFDGFVMKLSASGTTRVFSKLFGQEQRDGVYDIAVNAAGNVFVAGTGTLGATTVNGCGKPGDKGILGMLKADGTAWEYLTPFGEANSQIVVDTNDTAYVAGWGASGSVPIVGTVAQPTYAGGTSDAYVLKLDKLPNATVTGCAPCTGDVGSAGTRPCTTGLPKCSVSGECIAASTCSVDGDCGNATSGRICEAKACVDGCRGTGGNGCAAPKVCSSTTATAGTCRDAVADAGPDAAPSDAGPDSSVKDASVADATTSADARNDQGSLEGGGMSCATSGPPGQSTTLVIGATSVLAALAIGRRRRRSRR